MIKILIFDLSCIYSVSDAVTSLGIVNYRYHTNLCLLPSYNSFHKMNLFSSTKLINIVFIVLLMCSSSHLISATNNNESKCCS